MRAGLRGDLLGTGHHGGDLAVRLDRIAPDFLARPACRALAPSLAPSGAAIVLGIGGARGALLLGDQRLPVGNRDLVVVGMNFAEGQKPVTVSAVVDEGRLQRRLDARHLGQIDVAAELLTVGRLEVEFLDTIAAQNDHPGLLRMGRIDEHFVGH